ncbi:hypothetical protein MTO96_026862, partial [Rhipicephalus appendiculatus]
SGHHAPANGRVVSQVAPFIANPGTIHHQAESAPIKAARPATASSTSLRFVPLNDLFLCIARTRVVSPSLSSGTVLHVLYAFCTTDLRCR